MKKRILTLTLLLSLLLSSTAMAVSNSLNNFQKVRAYAGQFSDVPASSTFYSNITALYEYGLAEGKTATYFGIGDSVTIGQAVIFAGRIRSAYRTGNAELGPNVFRSSGKTVYEPYLDYLMVDGVLGTELYGMYEQTATRAQVAHILAGILPRSALPYINAEVMYGAYTSGRYMTDLNDRTPYYEDILDLYACGVCTGSDSFGSFHPNTAITRGELSAMLTRLFRPELRVTLQWNPTADQGNAGDPGAARTETPAPSSDTITYASLVPAAETYDPAPLTAESMDTAIRYMLCRGENTLTLQYAGLTKTLANQITQLAVDTVKVYCEQGYNAVKCSYRLYSGEMNLTFTAGNLTSEETFAARDYTLNAAIAARDQLWNTGLLNSSMNQYQKAKVYFDWICQNCTYDYQAGNGAIAHIPYALFHDSKAVCDGYTGAYNLFLKMEGISCYALPNNSHIWTVATLDGTTYHVDTTWGDSNDKAADYRYFAMTPEQSKTFHAW